MGIWLTLEIQRPYHFLNPDIIYLHQIGVYNQMTIDIFKLCGIIATSIELITMVNGTFSESGGQPCYTSNLVQRSCASSTATGSPPPSSAAASLSCAGRGARCRAGWPARSVAHWYASARACCATAAPNALRLPVD